MYEEAGKSSKLVMEKKNEATRGRNGKTLNWCKVLVMQHESALENWCTAALIVNSTALRNVVGGQVSC